VVRPVGEARVPFAAAAPWYVLLEISDGAADGSSDRTLEALLEEAAARGLVRDAVIASSLGQAQSLWRLREAASEAQKYEGGSIKHDVSVPIARIPAFLRQAAGVVEAVCPGARPVVFGHFGDGNVHYNVSQPPGMDKPAFLALWGRMSDAVHDLVTQLGGSISAEHGIGQLKREALVRFKAPVEIALMKKLKAALDPNGILNPGKLL
jgi:FAD/FMN-containing dehydrogenase